MGQSGRTSAGCLHVFQLIWEPQDGLIIPFTLFGQEMKKRRVLTDGFCVSQLEKGREEKRFSISHFLVRCATPRSERAYAHGSPTNLEPPAGLTNATPPFSIEPAFKGEESASAALEMRAVKA